MLNGIEALEGKKAIEDFLSKADNSKKATRGPFAIAKRQGWTVRGVRGTPEQLGLKEVVNAIVGIKQPSKYLSLITSDDGMLCIGMFDYKGELEVPYRPIERYEIMVGSLKVVCDGYYFQLAPKGTFL